MSSFFVSSISGQRALVSCQFEPDCPDSGGQGTGIKPSSKIKPITVWGALSLDPEVNEFVYITLYEMESPLLSVLVL